MIEPVPSSGDGLDRVRLRIDLQYDGTAFLGWAVQPGLRTVAGEVEAALTTVLRSPVPLKTVVAGRTDAGVHARGQVVHVDVPRAGWDAVVGHSGTTREVALRRRLSGLIDDDVRVTRVEEAPDGFDARFSATARHYSYRVSDDPAGVAPLRRHDVLDRGRAGRLDVAALNAASQQLLGLRDFASFCRRREGATTVRTLLRFDWVREQGGPDDGLVVARLTADAFCHSMVRALVGATLAVGTGDRDVGWPAAVLGGARRHPGARVVGPQGLVLEAVDYPPPGEYRARARQARARRDVDSGRDEDSGDQDQQGSR